MSEALTEQERVQLRLYTDLAIKVLRIIDAQAAALVELTVFAGTQTDECARLRDECARLRAEPSLGHHGADEVFARLQAARQPAAPLAGTPEDTVQAAADRVAQPAASTTSRPTRRDQTRGR